MSAPVCVGGGGGAGCACVRAILNLSNDSPVKVS